MITIPRPIRKAVNLALAPIRTEDVTCAACHEIMGGVECCYEPTPCCHTCAQELLAMLADYVDGLRRLQRTATKEQAP